MNVLAIDIGGTHVKFLSTGQKERRQFESGPRLTPQLMVAGVKRQTRDWKYDVVSIGYPAPVRRNHPIAEPHNLAKGWMGFNFKAAFKCPVKVINDAAMQALGSYRRGTMLFLGFGTGLGSAMVVEGVVVPMELGQLSYKNGTYEDYLGLRGLDRLGKRRWRKEVKRASSIAWSPLFIWMMWFWGEATPRNSKRCLRAVAPRQCQRASRRLSTVGGTAHG